MGSAASFVRAVRARKRFYTYGSDYFAHVVRPRCQSLIDEIGISQQDAGRIFDAFVKMDTDGSGEISVSEFHRHFRWKRGVFTERIFDTYSSVGPSGSGREKNGMTYEEFLVCVWCYGTYDARLLAQYIFNIFDIDDVKRLSLDECNALLRLVYYNLKDDTYEGAMAALRAASEGCSITMESFVELVVADNSILQPAFDIQSRIIEKTTGGEKWEIYQERRLEKFGTTEIPDIKCNGGSISSSAGLNSEDRSCDLSDEFLSTLFRRVERGVNAPDGYDPRLEEERYLDKLRDALDTVETTLSNDEFSIERVEERKALRKRLWDLVEEIKDAHVDSLEAERERDLGLWDRTVPSDELDQSSHNGESGTLEYSSKDEINEQFDGLIGSFNAGWGKFVGSYEERFGLPTSHWERLYDADQNLSFHFQWQTGERCYDQQVGVTPAICESCDSLIELTDYKCFGCGAPRSERNKKKYRGRVSLESIQNER